MDWFMLIFIAAAILYFIVGTTGCATQPTSTTAPETNYELTLSGTLDGQSFQGVAVGNSGPSHTISISSSDDIPYVIGQTCHRFEKHEKVIEQGWISELKQWKYDYKQSPTIEDTGDCPLFVCAYSSTVGAPPVQCAFIDFKNPKYQHAAENICNGVDGNATGTLVCHTKVGLIERIRFDEPMRVAGPIANPQASDGSTYQIPDQCQGKFIDSNNQLFEYIMPSKQCYLVFYAIKPPFKRTKFTALPYSKPLMTTGAQ